MPVCCASPLNLCSTPPQAPQRLNARQPRLRVPRPCTHAIQPRSDERSRPMTHSATADQPKS
eukprot:2424406-Rhodomonas_salina.1